jgi:hypothetical protein
MKALQPEVVEVPPERSERAARFERTDRSDRPDRRKPGKRQASRPVEENTYEPEPPSEPELTAMQVAWQEAISKTEGSGKGRRSKAAKPRSKDQEEIVKRTLEHRLPTGG